MSQVGLLRVRCKTTLARLRTRPAGAFATPLRSSFGVRRTPMHTMVADIFDLQGDEIAGK